MHMHITSLLITRLLIYVYVAKDQIHFQVLYLAAFFTTINIKNSYTVADIKSFCSVCVSYRFVFFKMIYKR